MCDVHCETAGNNQVDLSDPRSFERGPPHAHFARLRQDEPVSWATSTAGLPFWVVADHANVAHVLRSSRTFSAEHGMTLDTIGARRDPAAGVMLELTDPPAHGGLRRVIHEFFTREFAASIEPDVEQVVADIVRRVRGDGTVDLVSAIGRPLGAAVTGKLMGPSSDELEWLVDRAASAFEEGDSATRGLALRELFAYFGHEVVRRRQRSDDRTDVVGALLAAARNGDLTSREVIANCVNVVAGAATIRNAATATLVELVREPDRWRAVRERGVKIAGLVEELLRLATPALHVARFAVEDTELGGRRIDAGSVVTVWLPSANRDEMVFEQPTELVAERTPNPHLSFATGAHACIGAVVARSVLCVLFSRLFEHFERVAAVVDDAVYLPSTFVLSVTSCEATFTPVVAGRAGVS